MGFKGHVRQDVCSDCVITFQGEAALGGVMGLIRG